MRGKMPSASDESHGNAVATLSGPDLAYRFRTSFHVHKRKLGFMARGAIKIIPYVRDIITLTTELQHIHTKANEILATPTIAKLAKFAFCFRGRPCSPRSIESAWVKARLRVKVRNGISIYTLKRSSRRIIICFETSWKPSSLTAMERSACSTFSVAAVFSLFRWLNTRVRFWEWRQVVLPSNRRS